jgi:hypothetical protein
VKKTTDDDRTNREITNGIEAVDFLKSLTWCDLPAIRDAMFDIFKRTDDDDITLAVCSSVNKSRRELVIPRLRTMLKKLPHSESWHRETGYRILGALMQFAGKDVKNDFKEYLSNGSAQRAATVCSVLEEAHVDWALEFLTPILNDKRNVNKYRLCDFAASAIGELYPDLEFNLSDTQAERDRQIEKLKEELTKKKP